ncbi:MAG: GNAT family N-acetyltransferase [Chloroflexota bacterium]
MLDNILFKNGKFKDLPRIKEIELAGNLIFPDGRLPNPFETFPEEILRTRIENGRLLVVQVDKEIAGFAVFDFVENDLFLEEISVHPDFGRRGIGRKLMNHLLDLAREQGRSRITLTTFSDIKWNAPFYESMGFKLLKSGKRRDYISSHLQSEASTGMKNRIGMAYEIPVSDSNAF